MTSRRRHPKALGNLLLALSAFAVAIGIAEIAARVVLPPPRFHDAPVEFDAAIGFRGVPGYQEARQDERGTFTFALDDEGWRLAPAAPEASAGAPRVAFFGDSFLVGRGLRAEALLPHLFARRMAEADAPVTTRNLSVIDYGTAQQLMLLRQLPARERLDGVVLAVYVGNDLVNNEPSLAGLTDVSAGDYVRPYLAPPDWDEAIYLYPWRARLRRASRLAATLERGLLSLARQPRFAWLQPFPPRPGQGARMQRGLAPRESLEVLREQDPGAPWERAWERTFGLIELFRDEAEARGARFLVVLLPMEEQVIRTARTEALDFAARFSANRSLADLLDWELPERRFASFFARAGVDAVIAREGLRALAREGTNPYLRDRHLSAPAHAWLAEAVARWWRGDLPPVAPPSAQPVRWVPRAGDAPLGLDFRTASHERQLGDGWLEWFDVAEGGGWRIGPRSLAVVRDLGGDVLVTGRGGPTASYPFALTVELAGAGRTGIRIEGPGPFELRFRPPPNAPRERDGYAVVLVGQHGDLDADLRIETLEIEARR